MNVGAWPKVGLLMPEVPAQEQVPSEEGFHCDESRKKEQATASFQESEDNSAGGYSLKVRISKG